MAKKIIHLDKRGNLHCDNPRCGHDLELDLKFSKELIGYPCPKCGSNMLTEKDYSDSMRMFAIVDWINRWFGWLGVEDTPEAVEKATREGNTFGVRNHNGDIFIDRKK